MCSQVLHRCVASNASTLTQGKDMRFLASGNGCHAHPALAFSPKIVAHSQYMPSTRQLAL